MDIAKIKLYRIIHGSNLAIILRSGQIHCPASAPSDDAYLTIGNPEIIERRYDKPIPNRKGLSLRDTVSFYFGTRSLMLYNIVTGYHGIKQQSEEHIIYLHTDVKTIVDSKCDFVFTDGQANKYPLSQFYDSPQQLDEVDFEAVRTRDFGPEAMEQDRDLKRRKQAESHVIGSLPLHSLNGLIVKSERVRKRVLRILDDNDFDGWSIHVDESAYFNL